MPFITGLIASPLARQVMLFGAIALAILFILAGLRSKAEQAGRAIERLDQERALNHAQDRMLRAQANDVRSRRGVADRLRNGSF